MTDFSTFESSILLSKVLIRVRLPSGIRARVPISAHSPAFLPHSAYRIPPFLLSRVVDLRRGEARRRGRGDVGERSVESFGRERGASRARFAEACVDRRRPPLQGFRSWGGICSRPFGSRHPFIPAAPTRGERAGSEVMARVPTKIQKTPSVWKTGKRPPPPVLSRYALSVGKRIIKEPGSNPDHTALPNPLVSSPSSRRSLRAASTENARKPPTRAFSRLRRRKKRGARRPGKTDTSRT